MRKMESRDGRGEVILRLRLECLPRGVHGPACTNVSLRHCDPKQTAQLMGLHSISLSTVFTHHSHGIKSGIGGKHDTLMKIRADGVCQ